MMRVDERKEMVLTIGFAQAWLVATVGRILGCPLVEVGSLDAAFGPFAGKHWAWIDGRFAVVEVAFARRRAVVQEDGTEVYYRNSVGRAVDQH